MLPFTIPKTKFHQRKESQISMAALAHLGVGLAAKRIVPEIPVGYLVLGAYVLDILWFAFYRSH